MSDAKLILQWCSGCGAQMHEGEPHHKRTDPGHSNYIPPVRPADGEGLREDWVKVPRAWLRNTDDDLAQFEIMLERIAAAKVGTLIDGHWPLWARQDLGALRRIREHIRARAAARPADREDLSLGDHFRYPSAEPPPHRVDPGSAEWARSQPGYLSPRHNHHDDRDARPDCPACAELIRQAGG